jgi:hypothetical protein
MGGNFNACVGTRDECNETEQQAIGSHGVNQQNLCGDMVINMATAIKLKVTTSFFKHNHCSTFKDRRNGTSGQLDYFLTDATLGTKVIDTKRTSKEIGCHSDHAPAGLSARFRYESS